MHVPQSIAAATELRVLASVLRNIISPRTNSPIIQLFQDTMTGAYRMTQEGRTIPEHAAMNILARIRRPFTKKNRAWTGAELISAAFPMMNFKGKVTLENGQLKEGQILRKGAFGATSEGLVQVVYNDFSPERCGQMINDLQYIVTQFNLYTGFSVGISDLIANPETLQKVQEAVTEGRTKVAALLTDVHAGRLKHNSGKADGEYLEDEILTALRSVESKISENINKSLSSTNRIVQIVDSGSKGGPQNITQMMGALSQQLIEGKRVQYTLQDRTLPHFPRYDDGPESRGFVEHSFVDGLMPAEFFYHAQAGREGLIDTAVKSVTRDTKVLIQEATGSTRVVAIGEWIDGLMEKAEKGDICVYGPEDANMELLRLKEEERVYIPTVDENGTTSWGELTAVTRHDPGEQLFEVTTQSGRKVTVTAAHSLLVWNDETQTFQQRDAPSVKVGEKMPVTANLPAPVKIVESIRVETYLSKTDHVYGTDFNKAVEMMKNAMEGREHIAPGWWDANNGTHFTLPYTKKSSLQRTSVRSASVLNGMVYPYHASREHSAIPEEFALNEDNGIFLGLYLADGHTDERSGQVTISKNDNTIREFVKTWFDGMGISWLEIPRTEERAASIQGHSTLLARLLNRMCGVGSKNKHIPHEAFAGCPVFKQGLLNGYFSGDGTVSDRDVEVISASEELIHDISFLASTFGIFGKMSVVNEHYYRFSIRSHWAKTFAKTIELLHPEKQNKLSKLECTDTHRNFATQENVVLDPIISITPVSPADHPKMYDVTVPSTLNFTLANGLCVRDTSDTGYIQRRLMKTMEDQHVEYDGTVRNVTGSIVQFRYGDDGVDTTCVEEQDCELANMTAEDIYRNYALTPEEVNVFLTDPVEKINDDLVDALLDDRRMMFESVFRHRKGSRVTAPVHFGRLLHKYSNPYATKTDLDPNYVAAELRSLERALPTNKLFHALLHYYLAPRKVVVDHRLSRASFDELMKDIRFRYIKARVHAGEMVGALAAQSIGEPTTQLTLNSIAYHERVVCRKDGNVIELPIGELVEKIVAGAKDTELEHHPNNTTLAHMPKDEVWDALSVDEKGVISWKRLEAVTKHPVVNEDGTNTLVKIHTKGGRCVMATKAKSFLSKGEDGTLQPTRGDELRIGSQVPIMSQFPDETTHTSIQPYDYIDVGQGDRMPETIPLDATFGKFVGAYLAEGMANKHIVSISNNDEEYRRDALEWIHNLGWHSRTTTQTDKTQEGWTSTDVVIHCTQLARFLTATCGRLAHGKRVPAFAYGAPREFVAGLLSMYISGDGTVATGGRRCISMTSVSEELLDGISSLLTRFGVHARKSVEMKHKSSPFKARPFWSLRLPVDECLKFREHVRLISTKQSRVDVMEPPSPLTAWRSIFPRTNHIVWDPVTKIEEVSNPTDYVYDLTVADTRNFVHANGLCLRDTFHSAGTAKANATSGVPRIEELLSASTNPKRPSNVIYLDPSIATSQPDAIAKMKEIQKTTMRDITKSIRIYYDPYPLSSTSTAVEEDRELLADYQAFSLEKAEECTSPWIVRIELDPKQLVARNVLDMTLIQTKLMTGPLKCLKVLSSDTNAEKLVLRINFDSNVMKNPLQLRFLEDKILDTMLTGVSGIRRVFLRSVKNEMLYDTTLDAYRVPSPTQWVLDAEGTNLYDLLVFPGVDGTRTFSNDIHEVLEVFGIEAARLALYEEINEVFVNEKVNYHHLAVLVDTMTFSGRIVAVNRFGMSKNETGVLAKSSFEETSKVMFQAAVWAERDNMRGVSANIMFGQKPPCGTGFVDILLDEARLPHEGQEDEYDLSANELLEAVDKELEEATPSGECRMEDIRMEW